VSHAAHGQQSRRIVPGVRKKPAGHRGASGTEAAAMLKALGATRSYRISADELGLLDGAGSPLARFAAKRTP